jgi:heme exporter protein B
VVNSLVLSILALLLIGLWVVLLDIPLAARPFALAAVVAPAILGIAAVGTLLGALLGSAGGRTSSLTIVILPLVLPVVLAASEATRLMVEGNISGEWVRWVAFLMTFGVVFSVAGAALFEFAVNE